MKHILLISTLMILVSCNPDDSINIDGFEPISEKYPFEELNPSIETDYWELIYALVKGRNDFDQEKIAQNGELCSVLEEELCRDEFSNLQPEFGFAPSCLPGLCFLYIKYQADNKNQLVATNDELLQFLGTINTTDEALLWARANGYFFRVNDINAGAFKYLNSNFELIVLKTVSYCTPIQTNRYHLSIKSNGDIKILREEVFSRDENSCV